ncbi:MFS transporter [Streptomyces smaragdinus]|uniref:MFS transporter n=1 Tax=Streptomyces smaragdinus TaxID=2585196 RepID=UPI001E3A2D76|nr:MFS transporter [Streptomyces smaragdinus]
MWSRDFSFFFAARGIARLGDMMAPVALAAGLVQQGYGAGAVGAAMASMTACFAGFVLFGGVLADRFDARGLMIGSDLVRVVTQAVMAGLFFAGDVVLWQVCVLSAVNGICGGLFQPGIASVLPRIAHDVQGANGAVRTVEAVMSLFGPAAAGALVGFTQPGGVFVVHAATYALSAGCLTLLRLPPRQAHPEAAVKERASFRADLVEGWREFSSRTWMWGVIVIWMAASVLCWGPTIPLIATEVVREHGPGVYGLINSAMGVGAAIGAVAAMRSRPVRPLRAGSAALLCWWLMPASVALGLPVPLIAVGSALCGIAMAFWGVMWATAIQTQVPPGVVSRVHAYDVAGSLAMQPVGQALAGPASGQFGTREVLAANAVFALVTAVALLSVRAIRTLRRVERAVG